MAKILVADLNLGETYEESCDSSLIGGRLLGLELYRKYSVDKQSNPLVFATSPANVSNLDILVSGRTTLVGKSPLTGNVYSSNSGGKFARSLALNGYSALVVLGESDLEKYIDIDEKEITTTTDLSKRTITFGGPAKNGCLYSPLFDGTKGGVFGRGGFGKTFADKRLGGISYAEEDIKDLTSEEKSFFEEQNRFLSTRIMSKGLRSFQDQLLGAYLAELTFERNFRGIDQRKESKGLTKLLRQVANEEREGYSDVFSYNQVALSGEVEINTNGTTRKVKGPHNQSALILGPNLGIYNLNSIYSLYDMCNIGVDTLSFGALAGAVMDMSTQGDLTKEQSDGIDFSFSEFDSNDETFDPSESNFKTAVTLLRKISDPKDNSDFTKSLRGGVKKFTEHFGHRDYAMQVKGMGFSAYNIIQHPELALLFATSSRGPDHFRGGGLMDMQGETVAERVYNLERNGIVCDIVGIDRFARITDNPELIEKFAKMYGIDVDKEQFDSLAKKTMVLERKLLLETEEAKEIDRLPKRILREMGKTTNPKTGKSFKQDFEQNLREYYDLMGFNEQGVPVAK